MLEIWFDPLAIGVVLFGTLAATALRCGWADMRTALRAAAGLFAARFDPARARAELARHVRAIGDDGFCRTEPHRFGDAEFDTLSDRMIARRSLASIHSEHEAFKERRLLDARHACRTFESAAELAPVLGLAGTLIALGQAPSAAPGADGLVAAVGMAVVTTLYGLVASNFVFAPLASAIARRTQREENDRDEVVRWLVAGIESSTPTPPLREVRQADANAREAA